MNDMEEGVESAEQPSGGVVKKKGSSGFLIIKKKGDGIGGFGASTSKKGIDLKKEKKRPRLILSDSGSSDELDSPPRRKVSSKTDKIGNGLVVKKEGFGKDSSFSKKEVKIESDRKRSGLDVFEFDEYEKYDVKKMRKDYGNDRGGQSGNKREFGIGSSRNVKIDKIKHSYVDGRSSISGKSKGPIYTKKRHKEEDDETHLTISSLREKYREACDEPIRLQGRNGVLKVMVNKQKKPGSSQKSYSRHEGEDGKGSRSEETVKKSEVVRPSSHSDSKRTEKRVSFVKTEKIELKLQKSMSTTSNKARDSEKVDTDKPKRQVCSSTKRVKKEGKTTPPTEKIAPVKRGTGTEKQLLREKVRSVLLDAGWTIDYRPRRNRDYKDAVYINPSGTAYWSIIKAYDAFQKQLEEEDEDGDIKLSKDSSQSSPLPAEILSKLTRQTQKNIEREIKNHEEKLSFYMKQNHKSKKGRFRVSEDGRVEKSSDKTNSRSGQTGRCTLLVRSSEKGLNSEDDDFVPYMGKRTILAWLIDSERVRMSEKVQYMNRRKTRVMLEGWITRDGIHCGCCSKILMVSKFEIHAGSKQKQPFSNIFVESGLSLLQCQIEAWNKQEESKREDFHSVDVDGDDPNDDTCGLCGDGGDLICCDGCPSTFHQSCLDIKMLPPGDWHCPNCTCKFCGIGGGTTSEADGTTVSVLFTCGLCEKKYHESCSGEIDEPPNSDNATTFCGQTCQELFGQLRKLVGVKHELEEGYSWSLIQRMDPSSSDTVHPQRVECNSKLAVALSIMDECFLPIVDRRSDINLIHSVLYNCGSNFDRLNYSGFYTAILERGDEIVSAASIRIRGTQLAEMPFIGTRHIYRRRGMCRRLFGAIESVLCSLKVEKLIIPAVTEHMQMWSEVFNFNPLEELHKQEMRSINTLVFPGIDMLQKQLMKPAIAEGNTNSNSDMKAAAVKENLPLLPVTGKDIELDTSDGNELQHCDEAGVQEVNEMDDKLDATETILQVPSVPQNDGNMNCSSTDSPCEPKLRVCSKETIPITAQSESTVDLKCRPQADASPVNIEICNPVLDPPVKDKTQSSAGVLDNIVDTNENHNSVSVSTVICTDENSYMQSNSDLNHQKAVEVRTKLPVAVEGASEAEIGPKEGNIWSDSEGSKRDVCEVGIEVACVDTVPNSPLQISAPNTSENVYKNQSAIYLPKGTAEPGQPILDSDDHEVAAGESEQNTVYETSDDCNPVSASTLCGTDEGTAQLSPDLNNVRVHEVDCKVPMVPECGSTTKVSKVQSNIQLEDGHEVNVEYHD
ncbi:hypothetical protein LguiA_030910 [Lonicera macranthoides]